MDPRMDILKLEGENMKKIYSIFERLLCIFSILLLSLIPIIVFLKYNSEIILVFVAFICIVLIIVALLKLFSFPSHIIIRDNYVKVFDFPLLATNRFYVKKSGLILYNSEISINDVEKIEIVVLTKKEQLNYIGYKHLLRKYLKIHLKYGNPKYMYVGNYSKFQIKEIINIFKK